MTVWLRRKCPDCELIVTGLVEDGESVAEHGCEFRGYPVVTEMERAVDAAMREHTAEMLKPKAVRYADGSYSREIEEAPAPKPDSCGNCFFSRPLSFPLGSGEMAECRRHAPSADRFWPDVPLDGWCGEWAPILTLRERASVATDIRAVDDPEFRAREAIRQFHAAVNGG